MSATNAGLEEDVFDAFIEQLDRYVRDRLVPAEAQVVADDKIPDEILSEMREMGLFGVSAPKKYGGFDMNMSQFIETMRVLSWAMPAFRSVMSINVGMLTSALETAATEAQREEWFPKLIAGEIGCFALTEPDSGSDAAAMQMTALKQGDHYILNGTKRYISNAPYSQFGMIMARTSAESLPKNKHVSAFIMPLDLAGVSTGPADEKMGQQGSQISDLIFDDVKVPASCLLGGQEGAGFTAAMQALDKGRLAVAAGSAGYAARILETGLRYATQRTAFGERIANFQLIQAMLADSKAELYAAECMIRDAAQRFDDNEAASTQASCAKMFASEMVHRVADRVLQIHGGAGYLREYEAERFVRDVRIYRIYEGTTQIQQLVIAKRMLREFDALN